MVYSPELKEAMLRRLLPPNNESVTKIAREEGIPQGTLKYRPNYQPKGFESIEDARSWCAHFVKWYRFEHHHSGISAFAHLISRHRDLFLLF